MSEAILTVENLTTDFRVGSGFLKKTKILHAVRNVSLQIAPGEVLGLVGESGCGKSTLGRSILRLIPPTSGTVTFDGDDLNTLSKEALRCKRREMQMIFQDPYACLNPRMNVKELVRSPLDVFHIGTKAEREEMVLAMLRRVGMGEHQLGRYPHEFSGGQRQRIGIARALVMRPKFVVCDEPVSALDVSVRASVLNLLDELKHEMNLTLLFVSHDLSVVKHISDRVAVMYLGNIVELTGKDEIYANALHPYTRALLEAIPIPDPAKRDELRPLEGNIPSPFVVQRGCCFQSRCAQCSKRCREEKPTLHDAGDGHFVACHLYDERQLP